MEGADDGRSARLKNLRMSQTDPMNLTDLGERAEYHAIEAERLLAGKLGLINNVIKAGVHATLAVYYTNKSERSAG